MNGYLYLKFEPDELVKKWKSGGGSASRLLVISIVLSSTRATTRKSMDL
jgi:hypothetical protein